MLAKTVEEEENDGQKNAWFNVTILSTSDIYKADEVAPSPNLTSDTRERISTNRDKKTTTVPKLRSNVLLICLPINMSCE